MELRQSSFVFHKCFTCGKNFNVSQLTEINSNSVLIGEEEIEFSDLILDVCLISIDNTKINYICNECNSQLVYFHIFKREIRRYSKFADVLPKLRLLSKVDECLNDSEDLLGLQVTKRLNEIVISSEKDAVMVDKSELPVVIENDMQNETQIESVEPQEESQNETKQDSVGLELDEQDQFIEEYIEERVEVDQLGFEVEDQPEISKLSWDESTIAETTDDFQPPPSHSHDATSNESLQSRRRSSRKYTYPINNNSQLTEEQKSWINEQVRSCSVYREGQRVYECSLCNTILQMPGTFKKHLRDNHILKTDTQLKTRSTRQELKNEVRDSMIEVESDESRLTIWKCQRCEVNRIFRSQNGLKTHIRYSHIRGQTIDAAFVAKCEVTIQDETGSKKAWKCPECSKILSRRESLRNHMKITHPEVVGEPEASNEPTRKATPHLDGELLQKLLEKRAPNSSASVCLDCGIQFVSGTSRKEISFRIHQDCHKILDYLSHCYQLPKCEDTKTMFSNDDDLNTFLQGDRMQLIPCHGITSKVSVRLQDFMAFPPDHDPEAWNCGHCGAKFPNEDDCTAHIIILHSSKLVCPVDFMEFTGNRGISLFNNHMRHKHNGLFPGFLISCSYCSQEFETFVEKLAHMKVCDAKKFECDHCSRTYFTKTELVRHFRIVSGEIAFACEICSKVCVSTMDLRLHRTSHSNVKNYPCSIPGCGKAFKTPGARSSHMETHGNQIYSCPNCQSTFKQRAALQRHTRKNYCKTKQAKMQEVYEEICTDSQLFEISEVSN